MHASKKKSHIKGGFPYLTCPKEERSYDEEKQPTVLADGHSHRCCTYDCHHRQHSLVWEPSSNTVRQAASQGCQKLLDTPDISSDTSPVPHLLLTSRDQARPQAAHRARGEPEGLALPNKSQQRCAGGVVEKAKRSEIPAPFCFGAQIENSVSQAVHLR